jgi:hypothetical protein
MADMIEKNQWIVIPYEQAKTLPHLRISPIGVVPQRDRRPRTIVDYSFSGINQETCDIAPTEAMQFGTALQRIVATIVNANPKFGPVYLCKVDIDDGFYRLDVRPVDIPKLGVIIPSVTAQEPLIAFPLVLPMGWKNSPPFFCAVTETVADVTNERIRRHQHPPRHHLEKLANSPPELQRVHLAAPSHSPTAKTDAVPAVPPPTNRAPTHTPSTLPTQPVGQFDIYVDDFLGLAQGSVRTRNRIRRILFHTLDEVLRPKDDEDDDTRQEPISVKKLSKGDANWSTSKQMLGWLIDTIQSTITLPPHRVERLHAILRSISPEQRRVSIRKWQQMLGELRAMAIAIPGARGVFSHLQAALQTRNLSQGRIRVSNHVRATLADFEWLADSLQDRPTRLQELVAQTPCLYGTTDACGQGMGGIILPPDTCSPSAPPLVWRRRFPPSVQRNLVSMTNPHGSVTNSDLELAATVIQHDAICHNYDVRELTVHTSTDNRATQAWQRKGSTTTNAVPAFLLRLQAIHQRFYRYIPLHSYLPGKLNAMADDASRLWQLSDDDFLTHFNATYPQDRSWQLYQPRPAICSAVTCALHKMRSLPASFLDVPKQQTIIGSIGPPSASRSMWTHSSKTSRTPSYYSKSISSVTAQEQSRPAVNQSDLARWRTPYVPLARRSRLWGPRTHGSMHMATSISASRDNFVATPALIHHQTGSNPFPFKSSVTLWHSQPNHPLHQTCKP